MTRVVAVLGSVTPPGRLSRALGQALDAARSRSSLLETELIDLAELKLGFADGRPLEQLDDDTPAVVAKLAGADAVILASPVYRASLTGALKNLLDLTPLDVLRGKPCGLVAMGATQHHCLGVDWHLRTILAWFGALALPTSVYLSSADFEHGEPTEQARAEVRDLVTHAASLAQFLGRPTLGGPVPLAARR